MTKKTYRGKDLNVTFDKDECIHAGECVRGLPSVFDIDRRPWVLPDEGDPQAVRDVVAKCPTGALAIEEHGAIEDHGAQNAGDTPSASPAVRMRIKVNGPVLVAGPCELEGPDGSLIPIEKDVFALCRCGLSEKKPFCDGAHARAGWDANEGGVQK